MTRECAGSGSDGTRLTDGDPPEIAAVDGDRDADDRVSADGDRDADDRVSADAAVERIRERATDVRDAELDTALAKLEARGDLSKTDREAVEDLADSLVEALIAVPVSSLREADATAATGAAGDEWTVETALELFG